MSRMGDFGVVDYTSLFALAPRKIDQLAALGIFSEAQTDYIDLKTDTPLRLHKTHHPQSHDQSPSNARVTDAIDQ